MKLIKVKCADDSEGEFMIAYIDSLRPYRMGFPDYQQAKRKLEEFKSENSDLARKLGIFVFRGGKWNATRG